MMEPLAASTATPTVTTKPTLTLLCFLVPLMAGAGALDIYGSLTGKTVLMPTAMPTVPDLAPSAILSR